MVARGERRIAVFTSTRADLWPLSSVVSALADDPRCEVAVVASGSHLADEYGATLREIEVDSGVVRTIDSGLDSSDDPSALVRVAARCAEGMADVFADWRPDLLVVLGDRYELLGVLTAAVLHRVPVGHIHGGEITEGAFDEGIRHAITKLAHLHFCTTEEYAARVRSMGEEPWRVRVTGAPGIDRLRGLAARAGVDELERLTGHPIERPFGLLSYHPPTMHPEAAARELDALLEGCALLRTVIATYPGPDPGAAAIIERLRGWERERGPGTVVVESLGSLYPAAMAHADVMVGNSSSGIIEAPSFGVPVVNVGDRQRGRLRSDGVIDVPGEPAAVREAMGRALSAGFRSAAAGAPNPYGDGRAGPRIARVLIEQPLEPLLHKRFCDI
ncbi:MAG: UDP-N-acetylglucosamine 2-epimerase [Acidimicrobiales bacterium]